MANLFGIKTIKPTAYKAKKVISTQTTSTPPYIVEIKNATVYRKDTRVFDNLSLNIKAHEATAILGPNGAGKTTLLKLLTREIYPVVNNGSFIKLFGHETVNIWNLRKEIGLVSHEFQNTYETMATGLEVVLSAFFGSTGLYEHHLVEEQQKVLAKKILTDLHLLDLQDKCFLKLSTGQQRRLLLARAIVHQPQALILDEPTAGLDLAAAFQLIRDMRRWCSSGHSLVLVTHHVQEIIPEIERVIFLKNGKILADGTRKDLMTSKNLSGLYNTDIELSENKGFYSVIPRQTASNNF